MQWPGEPKVVNQRRPENAMARGIKSRQSKKARQCNGQGSQKSSIKEGQTMQWPGEPKVVNQRRPDNAMANVKMTKGQTTIYKALHRKLKYRATSTH
jgi:hypothetical protein